MDTKRIADRIAGKMAGETAEQEYAKKKRECDALLRSIGKKIGRHSLRQDKDKGNWGFAGDLGHVVELLKEVDEFLQD